MDLYNIVLKLKETSSILAKLEILSNEKNNDELKTFFKYSLGKQKYGIKKIPDYQQKFETMTFADGISILDELAARNITGNKAIDTVKNYLENVNSELANIFIRMLTKFPDCGISTTLCNRIWNNMFPKEIKLLKAMPYSEKNMAEIKYPAISQRKCDGARCLAFVDDKNVTFYTSSGKEYYGLDTLKEEFISIFENSNIKTTEPIVFDGELLIVDNGKVLPRKLGNGILNKSVHNTITKEESEKVTMVVWDFILFADYEKGKGSMSYTKVMDYLNNNVNQKHISVVETKIVNNKQEAFEHFQEMLNRGEEGTILKNKNMFWEDKRSKNCVKFKIIIENTLKIVGFNEGTGKYKDSLGAMICESKEGKVQVKIGSGFDDDIRKDIWLNQNDYIGKYAEIMSNGLIETVNGTYSLFLPRFANMRDDKLEADDFETIKSLSDGSTMLQKMEN